MHLYQNTQKTYNIYIMTPALLEFLYTKMISEISFIIIIGVFLYILISNKRKKEATYLIVSTIILSFLIYFFKNSLMVERPENALIEIDGYALPSGHSALSMFFGIVAYQLFIKNLKKKYRAPLVFGVIALVLSIGLSRIYFGVHTPFQVFIGFLMGAIVPIVLAKIYKINKS